MPVLHASCATGRRPFREPSVAPCPTCEPACNIDWRSRLQYREGDIASKGGNVSAFTFMRGARRSGTLELAVCWCAPITFAMTLPVLKVVKPCDLTFCSSVYRVPRTFQTPTHELQSTTTSICLSTTTSTPLGLSVSTSLVISTCISLIDAKFVPHQFIQCASGLVFDSLQVVARNGHKGVHHLLWII